MLYLNDYWKDILSKLPETGMGFQVGKIKLKDGRVYDRAVIIQCSVISEAGGSKEIEFNVNDIEKIELTHEKLDYK